METLKANFRKMRDTIVRGFICYFKPFRKTDEDTLSFSEDTWMVRIPGNKQEVEAVGYRCVIRKKDGSDDVFATVYDTRSGFLKKFKTIKKHGGVLDVIMPEIWKNPCRASIYEDYGDYVVFLEDTNEKPSGILTLGRCLKKSVEDLDSKDAVFSATKGFSKEFFEFGFLSFTDSENKIKVLERNGDKTIISDKYEKIVSPENKLMKSVFGQQRDEEVSAAVKKAVAETTPVPPVVVVSEEVKKTELEKKEKIVKKKPAPQKV